MRMGKGVPFLAIVCVSFLASASVADEKPVQISIVAKSLVKEGDRYVQFTLTNNTKAQVKFYWHDLPWNWHDNGLKLIPISEKREVHLAPINLGLPPFEEVAIGPGKSISGAVKLSSHFSNIEEILKTENVDLFWSYQSQTVDKIATNRSGGWVNLEKKK